MEIILDYKDEITENVLDPQMKELSKDIFLKEIMKNSVKDDILRLIYKWFDKMKIDKDLIKSVILIGSSAGYNYSEVSDMDVSIETKLPTSQIQEIWKLLPNTNLMIEKHPVNYYLTNDTYHADDVKNADAAYNILEDKWVKKEDKEKENFPISYAYEIARFFIAGFDNRINEYEIDNKELEHLRKLDFKEISMSEKELNDRISQKEFEVMSDLDSIKIGHDLLKSFRSIPFDGKKTDTLLSIEVKSNNGSLNNIVYKLITDMFGYEEILKKYEDIRLKLKEKINS
jgi:hypothetical protein